jgi:hypothetical protein
MGAAAILQLMMILIPIAKDLGIDVYNMIHGIESGKTLEELIAEAIAKRDDLPELPFKPE